MKSCNKKSRINYRKKCRKAFKVLIVFAYVVCISSPVHSQDWIPFAELGVNINQKQKVEYTDGTVNNSPALGYFANVNLGGKKIAFGLQINYSKIDLKNTTAPGVNKNLLHLMETYLILRYYPMLPTMRFGTKVAIRFTAGGMGGLYAFAWKGTNDGYGNFDPHGSPWKFSTVVFAGLVFSPFRSTTGLSVKLNYMPKTLSMQNFPLKNFTLKQPFSLSASLFIGPKIRT